MPPSEPRWKPSTLARMIVSMLEDGQPSVTLSVIDPYTADLTAMAARIRARQRGIDASCSVRPLDPANRTLGYTLTVTAKGDRTP